MVRSRMKSVSSIVALVAGTIALGAAPASAACWSSPWSNPTVVCADVEGNPIPQAGCDGVSTEDVTITASVSAGLIHVGPFEQTVRGHSTGPIC